jgi:hypothetical protein
MIQLEWFERGDGVWCGPGCDAQVCWQGETKGWLWTVPGAGSGHCETLAKAQIAALGVTVAMYEGRLDDLKAALARTKQAAQDADDAALVAAHGEVVWAVGLAGAGDLHTATVAGHPCYLEDRGDQGVKWWLDPEYYGHPHTWYAPDLETAKRRAAAAALRTPCKRWAVTLPDAPHNKGGTVEVMAVTSEGALYRATQALGWITLGCEVKGNAMEVRL